MNVDEERYRLCLQCREEFIVSGKRTNRLLIELVERAISSIQNSIKTGRPWRNEYSLQDTSWFEANKICPECPYVLEHIVIEGREVREQRRRKI